MGNRKDSVYANPLTEVHQFKFDDRVAQCFPDMITRSVPGYETIIAMTGVMAQRFAQADSHIYDLGCSLGASLLSMRQHVDDASIQIIGVDNSAAMIERCTHIVALNNSPIHTELRLEDMQTTELCNASVVVLNFTLQFIPIEERGPLIDRIYAAMKPGGILILSEKIRFEDEHLQQLNTELHHEFKRGNGYSDLEIAQKRSSLENYLRAETIKSHESRLATAGFSSIDVWFQCFNFASVVAIK
ncbi:carboxy-S-adenosyl-L-methionine synthase CmoA [Umboniibacter marinipuniceus]|uniref:Carboxy-S-adenosyl-L-methionine synthase n=1 Tax=Umboniibacter marinipuniceus TaxID=569599 RepID=A0A3M0A3J6_9GAMM|nr:carboxy-S-adenosyl-L-methionine synthase CmoA [Umboniibacter marinipuniceus]RMA79400.1 tRNA (cmo5U34)-methyltransferase [Umboniibacter marinipuniceus]